MIEGNIYAEIWFMIAGDFWVVRDKKLLEFVARQSILQIWEEWTI